MAMASFHIVSDDRTGRIRVRRVSTESLAQRAAEKAAETGEPNIRVAHGGDVCNSYGYPAQTEAALAVAVHFQRQIRVAVYATQIPANKVSLGGAAAANLPAARPIFDRRYGAAFVQAARKQVVREAMSDIACDLDPAAARRRAQRERRRLDEILADASRPTLAERLKKYKAHRLSERVAAANAAFAAEGYGYFIEMVRPQWFHLRYFGDYNDQGYVGHGLPSLEACIEAAKNHLPIRREKLAEQRRWSEQQRFAREERDRAAAAQREEEYSAAVMGAMPAGRIRFDAEGGFRVE